jgi:hypothetical protein
MNRNILIRIFISLALSFMTQQLYACKTVPTAKIVSPYTQYTCIGGSVSFDGKGSGTTGSYDGDNGDPHGGGNGIVTYYWNYSDDSTWHEDGGTPSHTFNGPAGTYWVYLYVEDDEEVLSETYDYCIVHVMKVEIDEPAPSEFPKYIGVDSSLTLKAKVTPSSVLLPQQLEVLLLGQR